jgi:hypothetical protein
MEGGSDTPEEEPLIRLDKLPHEAPPSYESAHPTSTLLKRLLSGVGSPTGGWDYVSSSPNTVYKFRIFNGGFIALIVLAIFLIVAGGALIAIAIGGSLAGAIVGPIFLLAGAWLVRDLPKSDCVMVTHTDAIVKGHFFSQIIPINQISSAEVRDWGWGGIKIVLNTTSSGQVLTPLEASRGLAGRATLNEACANLNIALRTRQGLH